MRAANKSSIYIGLMSGTSLDGIDGVVASFDALGTPSLLSTSSIAFPDNLRQELLSLNSSGPNELARAALVANQLSTSYAQVVQQVLKNSSLDPSDISAIGAHGQTVRHRPDLGYSIQLSAPALLAELTGIDVIADFRSRDIAAGGQGAPLVPMFHRHVFATEHATRVIVNFGGIANITVLKPGQELLGFDTGPANVLMDLWCHTQTGESYDLNGCWGASGEINQALLNHLLNSEPWFDLPAPKSTGRDLFNQTWLQSRLTAFNVSAPDVQATLRALTAETVARAIQLEASDVAEVLVCGGGAKNPALMQELNQRLACAVSTTDQHGIPSQDVEALAFAWLAWANDHGVKASSPSVTGAKGARILGARWAA